MHNREDKRSYFVGRAGDVRLDHTSTSRYHACLEVSDSTIMLSDLDSHNGTYRISGLEALPFTGGQIYLDEVFAFSTCIRSVRQMLEEVGEVGTWPLTGDQTNRSADSPRSIARASNQSRSTDQEAGARIERVRAKISTLLASGHPGVAILEPAKPRAPVLSDATPERADASGDDEHAIAALKQEVDMLRKMLASVSRERDAAQRISDLSLKRIELQDSLIAQIETSGLKVDMNTTAEVPRFVEADVDLESLDGKVDLDRRYFMSKNR